MSQPLSPDPRLARALAQQLASLSAAGVEQIGVGQVVEFESPGEVAEASEVTQVAETAATLADQSAAPTPVAPVTAAVQPTTAASSPPAPSPSPPPAASPAPSSPPAVGAVSQPEQLQLLAEEVSACTQCDELCANRTQTVFGVGNPNARLCFFGEAPGADEDRLGEPFVGKAGQLLTKIIEAMGLQRSDVYILNVLKCRPPGNRNPLPEEVANCRSFFERQLAIIQPEFICCLGAVATQNLLGTEASISSLRGKFQDWNGYQVMATYHPAYLLRNPSAKKMVWDDMQILMSAMGLEKPKA